MATRTEYRAYNDAHAQSGAPFACRDDSLRPKIWERASGKLLGSIAVAATVAGELGDQRAVSWSAAGRAHGADESTGEDLVMLPIDYIEGKAVYQGDVVYAGRRRVAINAAQAKDVPSYLRPWAHATMAPAVKGWPVCTMTPDQLQAAAAIVPAGLGGLTHSRRALADAVIAHECEAGNLVPGEQAREAYAILAAGGYELRDGRWKYTGTMALSGLIRQSIVHELIRSGAELAITQQKEHPEIIVNADSIAYTVLERAK